MGKWTKWRKYYAVDGLEVSKSGGVRRTYDDCRTWNGKSEFPTYLERQVDKEGNLYVEIRKPKRQNLRIDELVATCFLPQPALGQTLLIHKDKDKTHCWAENLQWATPYEYAEYYKDESSTTDAVKERLIKYGVYVSSDGKVKENDKELTIYDSFYDSDVDREVVVMPFVYLDDGRSLRGQKNSIENMMVAAFLPKPANMINAVLLHKDLDYKNCALDNLKWVEEDSEDYLEYKKKKKVDMLDKEIVLNPHLKDYLMALKMAGLSKEENRKQ